MSVVLKRHLVAGALILSVLGFIGTAFASSYITSFEFKVNLIGAVRYFDGNNIRFISSYAKSLPAPHVLNKTYTVELRRKKTIGYDRIGKVTLTRDSSGTASWTNVAKGNYYVYLDKANDGITLVDSYVKFQNY